MLRRTRAATQRKHDREVRRLNMAMCNHLSRFQQQNLPVAEAGCSCFTARGSPLLILPVISPAILSVILLVIPFLILPMFSCWFHRQFSLASRAGSRTESVPLNRCHWFISPCLGSETISFVFMNKRDTSHRFECLKSPAENNNKLNGVLEVCAAFGC